MIGSRRRTIDYESCIAFYLDNLDPDNAQAVESWLWMHPEVARRARADADAQAQIKRYYEGVLGEPIPPRLLAAGQPPGPRWVGRLGVAATVVLAATGGWWLGALQGNNPGTEQAFTQRVADMPLRDTPKHLMSNTNIANAVRHPDLTRLGYSLVGSKILQPGERPLIRFVYRSTQGAQVTIYARRRPDMFYRVPELALQDDVNRARWHHGGIDYVLVGDMPLASLKNLAQAAAGVMGRKPGRPDKRRPDLPPTQPMPDADELGSEATTVSAAANLSSISSNVL